MQLHLQVHLLLANANAIAEKSKRACKPTHRTPQTNHNNHTDGKKSYPKQPFSTMRSDVFQPSAVRLSTFVLG